MNVFQRIRFRRLVAVSVAAVAWVGVGMITAPGAAASTAAQTTQVIVLAEGASPADINDLPAWRWPNVELDGDTSGWLGAFKAFPIAISTLLLTVSQFLWSVLLGLMRFSIDAGSLIEPAAGPVNSAFATIGSYSLALFLLFWAFVLFKVVKALAKGQVSTALRTGGAFMVLFALLVSLVSASTRAVENDTPLAKGTLPWIAKEVAGFSTGVVSSMTKGRDLFEKADSKNAVLGGEGAAPTCAAYIEKLHARYESGAGANPVLTSMSRLWEQTQYNSWKIATFGMPVSGSNDLGGRTMCHWAEAVNNTPASEQQAIANSILPAGVPSVSSGVRSSVFGPYGKSDRRRAMTAWAACEWNGTTKSWQTTPEFIGVWSDDPNGDTYGNKWCSSVLSSNGSGQDKGKWFISAGEWDNFNLFGGRIADAFERDGQTAEHREKLAPAKAWASGFSGANTSDRLLQGFLSLAVAVFFSYALGFVALGMFLAQLLLLVLLMFAPITITMYAVGAPRAKSLAKLTGTTMVSQAFFGLLLTVLVALADLFQSIITNLSAFAGAGLIKTILYGMAPLLAFWCVRKLLMAVGMADILRPSGAVSFLASAAAVATGDQKMARLGRVDKDGETGITRGMKRQPGIGKMLQRADAQAPLYSNWNSEERAKREAEQQLADKATRQRIENRLSKDELTRRDKLNNWKDARSLSDDRLGRALRRAAVLGPGAIGAAVAGPAALAAGLMAGGMAAGGAALGVGAAGAAGAVGAGAAGAGAYALFGGKPRKDADTTVPVSDPSYLTNAEAAGAPELELAMFARALRTQPGRSAELQEEFLRDRLEAARLFSPVGTLQELSGARINLADAFGLRYDQIDVSPSGIGVPSYVPREQLRDLPAEALRHFSYHLPEQDRAPRNGESSAERAERIMMLGITRGFVTSDGDLVDALSKLHDIDLSTAEGRAEITSWQNGADHKTLGKKVSSGSNAKLEAQLVRTLQTMRARAAQDELNISAASASRAYAELGAAASDVDGLEKQLSSVLGEFEGILQQQERYSAEIAQARAAHDEQRAAELAGLIRATGKSLEATFGTVREKLVDISEVNAELTVDTLLALRSFDSEEQFTGTILREFEDITEMVEGLEDLVPAAYAGNADAIARLRDEVRANAERQTANARKLVSEASGIKASVDAAARQVAAVQRRTRATRTPTTRELIRAVELQEFPS
jgi:hypothetical protein